MGRNKRAVKKPTGGKAPRKPSSPMVVSSESNDNTSTLPMVLLSSENIMTPTAADLPNHKNMKYSVIYMAYLLDGIGLVFYPSYMGVGGVTMNQTINSISQFKKTKVAMPLLVGCYYKGKKLVGGHWVCILKYEDERFVFYDPMKDNGHYEEFKDAFEGEGLRITESCGDQTDGFSCGVFVVQIIKKFFDNSQKKPYQRIIGEIRNSHSRKLFESTAAGLEALPDSNNADKFITSDTGTIWNPSSLSATFTIENCIQIFEQFKGQKLALPLFVRHWVVILKDINESLVLYDPVKDSEYYNYFKGAFENFNLEIKEKSDQQNQDDSCEFVIQAIKRFFNQGQKEPRQTTVDEMRKRLLQEFKGEAVTKPSISNDNVSESDSDDDDDYSSHSDSDDDDDDKYNQRFGKIGIVSDGNGVNGLRVVETFVDFSKLKSDTFIWFFFITDTQVERRFVSGRLSDVIQKYCLKGITIVELVAKLFVPKYKAKPSGCLLMHTNTQSLQVIIKPEQKVPEKSKTGNTKSGSNKSIVAALHSPRKKKVFVKRKNGKASKESDETSSTTIKRKNPQMVLNPSKKRKSNVETEKSPEHNNKQAGGVPKENDWCFTGTNSPHAFTDLLDVFNLPNQHSEQENIDRNIDFSFFDEDNSQQEDTDDLNNLFENDYE